jgi:hypothetical protein
MRMPAWYFAGVATSLNFAGATGRSRAFDGRPARSSQEPKERLAAAAAAAGTQRVFFSGPSRGLFRFSHRAPRCSGRCGGLLSMTNCWPRRSDSHWVPSGGQTRRPRHQAENRRSSAPAGTDSFAPSRCARLSAERQRPLPDVRIFGGEVSF